MAPPEITIDKPSSEWNSFMTLALPILVVVRKEDKGEILSRYHPQKTQKLAPIVARAIRNVFDAPHGDVKVIAGVPIFPEHITSQMTALALQYPNLPDVTKEESATVVADFIASNFDAALVREMLGKHAPNVAGHQVTEIHHDELMKGTFGYQLDGALLEEAVACIERLTEYDALIPGHILGMAHATIQALKKRIAER